MTEYSSPIGKLYLTADSRGLTGVWYEGQTGVRRMSDHSDATEHISEAVRWLDVYFSGGIPDFTPKLNLSGTEFQRSVWNILSTVPYGKTVTYGDIARMIASDRGIKRMSAQAVGGAVGSNPVSVILPCHRVLGKDGRLTGYNGGLHIKKALLDIENIHYK